MTQDQQTILMFKGLIASLPVETQAKVKDAEQRIWEVMGDYPEGEAAVALGLIGAELQVDDVEMITK